MRIGLLGAIDGQSSFVRGLGSFCLDALRVERVVYLGGDDALDLAVRGWATQLVGELPEESAIWRRSLRCVRAPAEEIDQFIAGERARQALKRLQSLPDGDRRALEALRQSRLLLCHDRAALDAEDVAEAQIIAYGNDRSARVYTQDGRHYLCPGSLEEAGLIVLDDDDHGLKVRLFDRTARLLAEYQLTSPNAALFTCEEPL